LVRLLKSVMYNMTPKVDKKIGATNFGYPERFNGSIFDRLMNWVLATNVLFMVIESYWDFTDNEDWKSLTDKVDLFYSFVYFIEIGGKFATWSWAEYWTSFDNRFDFYSTWILGLAGAGTISGRFSHDTLKYFNLVRVLRLLKALSNVGSFRTTFSIISNMLATCADVLLMNFLVIYIWSALGVQLFGGELYEANPKFVQYFASQPNGTALDYFGSNFNILNFNDVFMGCVTLFLVMLTNWIDPVAVVTMALNPTYSVSWFFAVIFHLGFYLASPLLAFNVFTAFSIDVYCLLKEQEDEKQEEEEEESENEEDDEDAAADKEDVGNGDAEGTDDEGDDREDDNEGENALARNLQKIREKLWNETPALCLHFQRNKEGERMKVYKNMLLDDDDDAD